RGGGEEACQVVRVGAAVREALGADGEAGDEQVAAGGAETPVGGVVEEAVVDLHPGHSGLLSGSSGWCRARCCSRVLRVLSHSCWPPSNTVQQVPHSQRRCPWSPFRVPPIRSR